MAFTSAQQAQAAANLQEVIDRITSARSSLLLSPSTQFPVTQAVQASINKLVETALLCGAALED